MRRATPAVSVRSAVTIRGAARIAALAAAFVGGVGCTATVEPRLPDSAATALAERPMRHIDGQHVRLYFPEGRSGEARRFLYRVERCARHLRAAQHVHNAIADGKMTVILPEDPLNNAFVAPRLLGYETTAVVPTYNTADMFSLEFGLPPDPGLIGCHEITHYVQAEQVAGFAWFMNSIFGASYTPQLGLDSWFHEGLAVYYETKLNPGTGRLAWPLWRGAFAAGYAGRRINGGDLHVLQRDFHAGNAYLVGSHFVRFLAERYGEEKLWLLIHKQARSWLFPFGVNVRFWQAYDKSLSTLLDEFADEMAIELQPRGRPPGQRTIREAGSNARYARAADGTEAMISASRDRPARLTIHGPDGSLRVSRELTDVTPPRTLAIADPMLVSGLSFTADARSLYFVALDRGPVRQVARLLRYDVGADTVEVVARDLGGVGGSISPDGSRYAYARVDGDHHDLAEFDLRSGAWRILAVEPGGAFVSQPRYAPDGRRLVASEFDGQRFAIAVFDAGTGRRLNTVAGDRAAVHDPSWLDDRRILYLRAREHDAAFQAYSYDLDSGQARQVTAAPYLAFQPRADGRGTVRFLNREGWGWTLDEVALPPRPAAPPSPSVVVAAAPAQTSEVVAPPEAPLESAAPASQPMLSPEPVMPAPSPAATPAAGTAAAVSFPGVPLEGVALDQPASAIDGLFVPRLHGLTMGSTGRRAFNVGLVLAGNDRLEKHRWMLGGLWQTAAGGEPSGFAAYTNRTLAPLTITASVAETRVHDVPLNADGTLPPADAPLTLFRRDRQAALDLSRTFWGNPVGGGFVLYETYRPGDLAVPRDLSRFSGLRMYASFVGLESTPYAGTRRAFVTTASVGIYPQSFSTVGFTLADVRAEVAVVPPLPFLRRHRLSLRVRGRSLAGSGPGDGLLVVGGYQSPVLGRWADRPETREYVSPLLPPGIGFAESMAGFEDHPFATDRIVIGSAGYNLPFIIDVGTASTLGLLPALFVRQLDLSLFATAASDGREGHGHAAAGGALTLRSALWLVGFDLRYQLARRLTDDRAVVHLLTLDVGG